MLKAWQGMFQPYRKTPQNDIYSIQVGTERVSREATYTQGHDPLYFCNHSGLVTHIHQKLRVATSGELQGLVGHETDCVSVTEQIRHNVSINQCKWNQWRQSWLDREYYLLHPPPFTAVKYFMFPSRPLCHLHIHCFRLGHLSAQ